MLTTVIEFNKCVFRMPLQWSIWLMILMAANMIGPLFFLDTPEGRAVLGVFVLSAGMMMFLFSRYGFTRILGMGHVLWLGLLPWLWGRFESAQGEPMLGAWVTAVLLLNGLSLMIDFVDVIRYVRGDRAPTIAAA